MKHAKIWKMTFTTMLLMVMATVPLAAQESDPGNTATGSGSVQVMADGALQVYMCPWQAEGIVGQGDLEVSTKEGGSARFEFSVCYLDTAVERDPHTVTLSAGPLKTDSGSVIAASNIRIVQTTPLLMNNVAEPLTWAEDVGVIRVTAGTSESLPEHELSPTVLSWPAPTALDAPVTIAVIPFGKGISQNAEGSEPNDSHTASQSLVIDATLPPGTAPGEYTTEFTVTFAPNVGE